ncbi:MULTISPECIES: LytR/AlgR family response regulator transcription factor [unclassified Pedobacter]|uniref:LytR/AlgR family response regulator transcription factor n=1 Tax=unclassified Pedobacter TaxID=2628915 RepID=UPI000B4B5206|nr:MULTISPECIES: LytTR family transcriptional regulator DNA-binding domain-containing protein [unclassified Pedobacter]MCX2585375.1 LytTR family transcriptional regulator DNA-binding domain-containing protein [Pedobacter sp. MR22-3]OWK70805.1 DNA-binding response regulator [Pedobacter sp. AJM]
MIRAILIDDEPLARDIVKFYLSDHTEIEVVAECCDGFEGLKAITLHQPDLIFLDIQMPKISGFEMLELVDDKPAVIFTTAFDEFAIKAFEVNAVDYLLKPIDKGRFEAAMKKLPGRLNQQQNTEAVLDAAALSPAQNNRVVIKKDGVIKIIPTADINYLEADDDYVKMNTVDGIFYKNKTMAYFEQTLDAGQFIRIHRSYIINLAQVTKIELKEKDSYVVLLKSDIWLPVSKTGYVKLKAALGL